MLNVVAILKEKVEEQKLENKVNRIKNAIQAARLNAETDLMEVADERIKTVETFKDDKTEAVLTKLCDLVSKEKSIKESLENLKEVEDFLFKDIKDTK